MTSSTKSNLVEHVGRAIADADMEDYMEFHHLHDARARAAIRATLEYVRDKVKKSTIEITNEPKNIPPDIWTFLKGEMQEDFRDMMTIYLDALLLEIDQDGGKG